MKMKLNKKIIVCINLVIIVMISGICAIAHEISESERIEVIFSENSIFTEDEKHLIESSYSVARSLCLGKAGFADTDGIRNFKAAYAEQRTGHGKIRATRAHIRGHPRLHRKFPENAHQQSPRKAA